MTLFLLGGLVALLLLGMPIGIAMGAVCLVYFFVHGIPLGTMVQQAVSGSESFVLTAIPLFMLAGELMNGAGITERLIRFCHAIVGHFRGGLALVTIVASMIFAGMSGSTLAEIACIGTLMIPSMVKEGYGKEFAAAITAASAEMGPIIPPSIPMVLTGALARVSVGRLFLGGAVPGVLYGLMLMGMAHVAARWRGYPTRPRASIREVGVSFRGAALALLTPLIIIGGILLGVFTPTEAAAVAAGYGLALGVLVFRQLSWTVLVEKLYETALSTGTVMFIVAMANVYSYVLTRERLPEMARDLLFSVSSDPYVVLALITVALLVLGCFLSTTPALLLSIPLLAPIVPQMGYDPIHFYVIVTITLILGTLTPPVALSLYLASSIAAVAPERCFISLAPFLVAMLVLLVLTVVFPGLVLWLPNMVFR